MSDREKLVERRDAHTRDAKNLRADAQQFRQQAMQAQQQAEIAELNAHRAEAAAIGVNETIELLFSDDAKTVAAVTPFPNGAVPAGAPSHAESAG